MTNRLDILLINPGNRTSIYQVLGNEFAAIENPVWAGLIATFLRNKGVSVDLLDANALDLAPEQVAEEVARRKPLLSAVVVYGHQPSASTQVMPSASAICAAVGDLPVEHPLVLVGGHVASLPEQTLREEDCDYVCSGEGPYTLLHLVEALKGTRELSQVGSLVYWNGQDIAHTSPAPLVTDLDSEMPGIAWDLLPMDRYRAHNWHCFDGLQRQPYASVYTTLGCPYKCSFCCIQAPFKEGEAAAGYKETVNTYRRWSPNVVVDQLEHLRRVYGVRNIKIADELFVLNKAHVEGVCNGIIERGLDLNIWAYARVDTVKQGMAPLLKRAGVNWVALGIEAANPRVRDQVQKGFDQNDIRRCIAELQEHGIYIIANYIFGLPEDDLDTMRETLDLALDLNCEFANLYTAMAYPGSDLYTQALREGWDLPDNWGGYSQHGVDTRCLPTKYLSGAQVLRFRDEAFHTYFTNPRYLDMIERKFGPDTVEHIREMTAHRLDRKYA
jgi:anaerobic magnesium-protoporphyrin IX monomethyl ester cyclase